MPSWSALAASTVPNCSPTAATATAVAAAAADLSVTMSQWTTIEIGRSLCTLQLSRGSGRLPSAKPLTLRIAATSTMTALPRRGAPEKPCQDRDMWEKVQVLQPKTSFKGRYFFKKNTDKYLDEYVTEAIIA